MSNAYVVTEEVTVTYHVTADNPGHAIRLVIEGEHGGGRDELVNERYVEIAEPKPAREGVATEMEAATPGTTPKAAAEANEKMDALIEEGRLRFMRTGPNHLAILQRGETTKVRGDKPALLAEYLNYVGFDYITEERGWWTVFSAAEEAS